MMHDLLVVGGGPAGLYAAFYAGLRDLSVRLLEADQELGGRLRYYPEKTVWDVGGLPPTLGEQLRRQLEAQASTFGAELLTGRQVVSAHRQGGLWHAVDQRGHEHRARALIVAVGYGQLATRRLEVSGAREAEGTGVFYYLTSTEGFRGQHVVISGGGNSAVDWAHQLAPVATKVTLVHRRTAFRAHERVVARLAAAGVDVLVPWRIAAVGGPSADKGGGRGEGWVDLVDGETQRVERRRADAVLVGHGLDFVAGTGLLGLLGQPGVFAAGDCVQRDGKAYLMASTFPEAAEAVNAAQSFLDPSAERQAMVSSHHQALNPST